MYWYTKIARMDYGCILGCLTAMSASSWPTKLRDPGSNLAMCGLGSSLTYDKKARHVPDWEKWLY